MAYREAEQREETPLVDRVRTEEEWRLMKRIASYECKQRREMARAVATGAVTFAVVAAICAACVVQTPASALAAFLGATVLVFGLGLTLSMHDLADNEAGNLAALKVDLQRERSR